MRWREGQKTICQVKNLVSFSRPFSPDGHVPRRVSRVLEVLLPVDRLSMSHLRLDTICAEKYRKKHELVSKISTQDSK